MAIRSLSERGPRPKPAPPSEIHLRQIPTSLFFIIDSRQVHKNLVAQPTGREPPRGGTNTRKSPESVSLFDQRVRRLEVRMLG